MCHKCSVIGMQREILLKETVVCPEEQRSAQRGVVRIQGKLEDSSPQKMLRMDYLMISLRNHPTLFLRTHFRLPISRTVRE